MKKRLVYLASILLLLAACSGNEVPNKYSRSTSVGVVVKNKQGENLLDTLTPNAYRYETIYLYYEIDGVWKKYYEPLQAYPKGFDIYTDVETVSMEFFPYESGGSFSNTLIQWNEHDADTIRCEFQITPYSTTCIRVWANSELKWDWESKNNKYEGRGVEIIRPD